jgi:hypothetical protein
MRLLAALTGAAVAFATALSVTQPPGAAAAAQQTRPNILLIQADDHGYGDLSAYGQSQFVTPQLDRMAARGARFTQYYAGSTVCAPSRAALMTGLHTGHTWIRGNGEIPLRPEDVTVASVLRDAGYRTAVIGKWGLGGPGTTGQPDLKGFEYSFGFLDHRHAHRQFTDHLFRNAQRVATDLTNDYVNDLFTSEVRAFIDREDACGGAGGRRPLSGGQAFSEPEGGRCRGRVDGRVDWVPVAGVAARRVRRDDRAHGS